MRPESPLQWHDPDNVTKTLQRVYKILRRNVSYGNFTPGDPGQNIDGYPAKATTPGAAGTEFAVAHKLSRVPNGFHVVTKNGATDIYQSRTSLGDMNNIYLKATGTGVSITLFIF